MQWCLFLQRFHADHLRRLIDCLVGAEAGGLADVATLILLLVHSLLRHHDLQYVQMYYYFKDAFFKDTMNHLIILDPRDLLCKSHL